MSTARSLSPTSLWAWPTWTELRTPRYGLLVLVVSCQAITLLISWPAWNVRTEPINLPLLPLPQFSFGIFLLASLLSVLLWPRAGVLAHALLVLLSLVWDQYRLQPQVISLVVLMLGCVFPWGLWFARYYLAAMWLWAGLHKLTSHDWITWDAWYFLESCGLAGDPYYYLFALAVGIFELTLGILAIVKPRWAIPGCLALHLGLLVLLSPWMRNYNPSVWPWNFASAIVGAWILWQPQPTDVLRRNWRYEILAVLFLLPAGYWCGMVNAHLAFVLYSGNLPHAYHTSRSGVKTLSGWTGLTVPFPDSPRLFRQVFAATAEPGDKLAINDPRWGLPNRYYEMLPNGEVRQITRAHFHHAIDPERQVDGVERSSPQSLWRAQRAGVQITFDELGLEQTAELSGQQCTHDTLALLLELPNLRELRLNNGAITDADLATLLDLPRLEILEVRDCQLTPACFTELARVPTLNSISIAGLTITGPDLEPLTELPNLTVLHLPDARLDETACQMLGKLTNLQWLDLSGAKLPGNPLSHIARLPELYWLNLSQTSLTAADLEPLARASAVGILQLQGVKLDDAALAVLARLKYLEHLAIDQASLSAAQRQALRQALPHCKLSE